ncbi:unnamed protein product [Schistosoma curassoni]|uniref:PUB domain-containing protein n=1 Tax=Schistosoma curassoni TaxID=6186 RepID=A0A183K1K9_9TREM|nr:unnamed protein product [Schistosoma curassoni]
MKQLYDTTKKLAGKYSKPERPVKDKESRPITEIQQQRNRWVEYFEEILNRPAPINPPNIEAAHTDPTTEEIRMAARQMKSGKAAGPDNIPAEALTSDIEVTTNMLHFLFKNIWEKSSTYTYTKLRTRNSSVVDLWKSCAAFLEPKSMLEDSQIPKGVMIAVLGMSSTAMEFGYVSTTSIFEKAFVPLKVAVETVNSAHAAGRWTSLEECQILRQFRRGIVHMGLTRHVRGSQLLRRRTELRCSRAEMAIAELRLAKES